MDIILCRLNVYKIRLFFHRDFEAQHFSLNIQAAADNFIPILGRDVIKMIGNLNTSIMQLLHPDLMGQNPDDFRLERGDCYFQLDLSIRSGLFFKYRQNPAAAYIDGPAL